MSNLQSSYIKELIQEPDESDDYSDMDAIDIPDNVSDMPTTRILVFTPALSRKTPA